MHATDIDAEPRTKSRKVRALLAGGLILGIGAAVTLAAWNDSEFATGTFTAGAFNLVGSANGTTFADHTSAGTAAALSFSTGFNNLSPTDTVAAPFVLHLDANTNYDADVVAASAGVTGAAASHLTYGIEQVASVAACTPTATGTEIVPAGTALTSVAGATGFELDRSTDLGNEPGADVFLCVQVTADGTLVANSTATATWGFTATSVA